MYLLVIDYFTLTTFKSFALAINISTCILHNFHVKETIGIYLLFQRKPRKQ